MNKNRGARVCSACWARDPERLSEYLLKVKMISGDSGFSCCILMAYLVCFICPRSKCFICFITSHAAPPVGLPSFVTAMADYITPSHPELLATTVDFPSCHITVCAVCVSVASFCHCCVLATDTNGLRRQNKHLWTDGCFSSVQNGFYFQ